MARRTDSSCLGKAVKGYLLLTAWLTAGYALALPIALADLPAGRYTLPEQPTAGQAAAVYGAPFAVALGVAAFTRWSRRGPWWAYAGHAAVLLVASQAAVVWAEARFDLSQGDTPGLIQSGAAALTAYLSHRAVRWWDDGGFHHGRRRPAPGEIWHAYVPYRDTEGGKERYCVVMRPRLRHVEVLQITSQDKDRRADHIRIPNAGWDHSSGKDHWVEIGLPPRVVRYDWFTEAGPKGDCPKQTWRQLRARQPATGPVSALRSRISGSGITPTATARTVRGPRRR
ncbi:type II toxin-antitoxin system PemK/MazF family toxin [Streptomyces phaeolivaceus]|uniref:Type II toxin-antitoxin system PemK/MazF family toxin n=1 Tax=Streptomyces phaeolivaceus TaxID=2653200 RepID=A0A5P8K394_9ACTN|nr:type II toxin-antitoxin system PemK/MazF family toxin [Streptomyces phaeolivaceus]QFQ97087.1 type II toxin-antitoxin system PemK/MazF family toxin [Streptomyces phaeolivaceus]